MIRDRMTFRVRVMFRFMERFRVRAMGNVLRVRVSV